MRPQYVFENFFYCSPQIQELAVRLGLQRDPSIGGCVMRARREEALPVETIISKYCNGRLPGR